MLSGEAEFSSAAVAYMKASHLRIFMYDLKFLCSESFDGDNMNYEPEKIIIDDEATISMAKYNKDTARNRHVARRFHYMRQGTTLNEHNFHWISIKYQLSYVLTRVGIHSKFKSLWEIPLYDNNTAD